MVVKHHKAVRANECAENPTLYKVRSEYSVVRNLLVCREYFHVGVRVEQASDYLVNLPSGSKRTFQQSSYGDVEM